MSERPVEALVLAAGQSRRFGTDKRQARLPDGRTVLDASLALHTAVWSRCWVVLRAGDAFGEAACVRWGAQPVWVPTAGGGLGDSLAAGVRAVLARGGAPAAPTPCALVLALADMPWVQPKTLLALHHAVQGTAAASGPEVPAVPVVPLHKGRSGHPRALPWSWLPALCALQGEVGARNAIDWSQALLLVVNDPGVCQDIDHPADLAWRPSTLT